eukprot:GEMP01033701.1.p1 GENE.GEMP01033701.1~~GEMP01033701.1.p1  ORF type:complete len:402 (+),score=107.86 GEMP01033701.1:191-1396(+)
MPEVVVDGAVFHGERSSLSVTNDSWAGGRQILEVCGDFTVAKCDRGPERCKFAHPDDRVRQVAKEANVCLDSLMRTRKCTFKNCRYYHPPPHIEFKDISNGRLDLCLKFMDSSCDEPECSLAHPEKEDQIVHYVAVCDDEDCADEPRDDCVYHHRPNVYPVDVCYDYTQGKCSRGDRCKFAHTGPVAGGASRSGRPTSAGPGRRNAAAESPRQRRRSRTPPRAQMPDRRFERNVDARTRSRSAHRERTMRGRERSPPRDKPSTWGKGEDTTDSMGPKGKGKGEMMRAMMEMCSWMWGSGGGGDWSGKGDDSWAGKGKGSEDWNASGDSAGWKGGKGDWGSGGDKNARGSSRGRGDDRAPRRDDRDRARGSDKPRGEKRDACRDFDRGMCDRGSKCVFAHVR